MNIDRAKLLQWLQEQFKAHLIMGHADRADGYYHTILELNAGKFNQASEHME